jgi:hypothetical protein
MLGTTANKNETSSKRRDKKMIGKLGSQPQDFELSQQLEVKKALMNRLLYRLNIGDLHEFVQEPATAFLINFFADNDGLNLTDPNKKKPCCRKSALKNLISKTKIYK